MGKKKDPRDDTFKAVVARAKKAVAKKAEDEENAKAQEDAYWQDDDEKLAKKLNRKEEKVKKRLERQQRKTESKEMEREELERISIAYQKEKKVTLAEIEVSELNENKMAEKERVETEARKAASTTKLSRPEPLLENLNRSLPVEEALTVDEALLLLTLNGSHAGAPDRRMERRAQAAYNHFEKGRMPILKAENPSMGLSQLKQRIFEEWKKSPENPMRH